MTTRPDPIVEELGWYFAHAEADCEIAFLLGALDHVSDDIPGDAFRTHHIGRARRIRQTLARMPERWHRVLSKAFEPRAFRHTWHRFGKAHDVELVSVAVATLAYRLRFERASVGGDYRGRKEIGTETAVWYEGSHPFERRITIDGFEAFTLTDAPTKVVHRASRTAARMLTIALEHYRRARRGPGGGEPVAVPEAEWREAA